MLATLKTTTRSTEHLLTLPVCSKKNMAVTLNEIVCLEAISNYTLFHFSNGKKLLVSRTMKDYMAILEDKLFVRTHKSFAVNMRFMIQYDVKEEMSVLLKDGRRVSISRRKKKEFVAKTREAFGSLFG